MMEQLFGITGVKVIGDHRLRLTFEDGTVGDVDFAGRASWYMPEPLRDPAFFAQVEVHPEAKAIIWPGGIDMDAQSLYEEARQHPVGVARVAARIRLLAHSLTPVEWFAVVLCAGAAAAVAVSLASDVLDAWAPELAVSAVSIAITISVVERLLQRAEIDRIRPRTSRAHSSIIDGLENVVRSLTVDYRLTHDSAPELPPDWVSFFDAWIAWREKLARGQETYVPNPDPYLAYGYLVHEFASTAKSLARTVALDREVLSPRLVVAADALMESANNAGKILEYARAGEFTTDDVLTILLRCARRLQDLITALSEEGSELVGTPGRTRTFSDAVL